MIKSRFLIAIMLLATISPVTGGDVVDVWSQNCTQGVHKQPRGPFAIHLFCDGALGRNVAIFLDRLGAPLAGKYTLGKRFWQNEEWSHDVTSFSWLKNNYLLLATSHIYGTGAVYKLNLDAQSFEIVLAPAQSLCVTRLISVQDNRAEVGVSHCETLEAEPKVIEIAL